MGKYLKKTQEEIENWRHKEKKNWIELGIIKLTKMKNPGPNGFIGAFYQIFK